MPFENVSQAHAGSPNTSWSELSRCISASRVSSQGRPQVSPVPVATHAHSPPTNSFDCLVFDWLVACGNEVKMVVHAAIDWQLQLELDDASVVDRDRDRDRDSVRV